LLSRGTDTSCLFFKEGRAMNAHRSTFRSGRVSLGLGVILILGGGALAARADAPSRETLAQGRDLFLREWTPGDARSHGGDGLGPVYNDSSCVACHNAGAPGGAGPSSKNVDILSAIANRINAGQPQGPSFLRQAAQSLLGIEEAPAPAQAAPRKPDPAPLVKAHAGFRTARSVVLHKAGTDPDYESWRRSMLGINRFVPQMRVGSQVRGGFALGRQGQAELDQIKMFAQFEGNNQFNAQTQVGEFSLSRSQRNPTALFGAGLIDSIPEAVLEEAAKAKHPETPEVAGRVSRQKDGRIGRFGWKAQTPSLADFVLTACAVELGLEVPNHHQGGLPQAPEVKAKGLDLTDQECAALVAYVRSLPTPIARVASIEAEAKTIASGKASFESVGCASCHTPKLGEVDGIYSDLLLHQMGPELGDVGAYEVFDPNSSEPDFNDSESTGNAAPTPAPAVVFQAPGAVGGTIRVAPQPTKKLTGPANRFEWRTPPLWGVRDSGPYLHDGRAATLDQAIAFHNGEAAATARRYFALKPAERQQVQAFLKSLVAPTEAEALAQAGN
jgi:CxxC motif-containing protein (DUF1111 family)